MRIVPVIHGVHALTAEHWQAYVWDTGEGLVLVDTGVAGSETAITDALEGLGRDPRDVREILVTHSHNDHRGSLAALVGATGATVLAHDFDAPVIRGAEPEPPPDLTDAERPFAEAIIPRVPTAPPAEVGRPVRDGDTTLGGGVIVHVPGHTSGSIALHVPRLGLLFTGDTIAAMEGRLILGPFNVDRAAAATSVRRLAQLEFEVACFGHGEPLFGGASAATRRLAERLHA